MSHAVSPLLMSFLNPSYLLFLKHSGSVWHFTFLEQFISSTDELKISMISLNSQHVPGVGSWESCGALSAQLLVRNKKDRCGWACWFCAGQERKGARLRAERRLMSPSEFSVPCIQQQKHPFHLFAVFLWELGWLCQVIPPIACALRWQI